MGSRLRRAVLSVLLAGPLGALGICAVRAPLAAPPAVCAAETGPADCCSRSGGPASPRAPSPDRCAACGSAACPSEDAREGPSVPRGSAPAGLASRPAEEARTLSGAAARRTLLVATASPPRHLLLATLRN